MIKGSIQEEDTTIVNTYAPNIGVPQYIRKILTDIKEIDNKTIIVGDFNTPLTPMDRSSKQKINKETQVLNDTLNEMDFIDIFRTLHSNAEEYTFFSSGHGTFTRIFDLDIFDPRWWSSWVKNQTSVNLRKLKSYQASSLTTMLRDYIPIARKKWQETQTHGDKTTRS